MHSQYENLNKIILVWEQRNGAEHYYVVNFLLGLLPYVLLGIVL